MNDMKTNTTELTLAIDSFLTNRLGNHTYSEADGAYLVNIYADYRDKLSDVTLERIFSGDESPSEAFYDAIDEIYSDEEASMFVELLHDCEAELSDNDGPFPEGLTPEQYDFMADRLREKVVYLVPSEHFLRQSVPVAIMLDTGDGNYDYTLNSFYPAHGSDKSSEIDDRASILWLTQQQGYTKDDLLKTLRDDENESGSEFLSTACDEVCNICSSMNTTTFILNMELENLIKLNDLMSPHRESGLAYETALRPDCGTITLSKDTYCGLFNPWTGGGSLMEVKLEKDVVLPIKYIRCALPDGCADNYGVQEVYGFTGAVWESGDVLEISGPQSVAA